MTLDSHPVSNADANAFAYFERYGDRIPNSKSQTMYISSDCLCFHRPLLFFLMLFLYETLPTGGVWRHSVYM
jgi:hypothetical protein